MGTPAGSALSGCLRPRKTCTCDAANAAVPSARSSAWAPRLDRKHWAHECHCVLCALTEKAVCAAALDRCERWLRELFGLCPDASNAAVPRADLEVRVARATGSEPNQAVCAERSLMSGSLRSLCAWGPSERFDRARPMPCVQRTQRFRGPNGARGRRNLIETASGPHICAWQQRKT